MNAIITVERRWDGMYDVIERTPDGFLVLGEYACRAIAEKNAARWRAEIGWAGQAEG